MVRCWWVKVASCHYLCRTIARPDVLTNPPQIDGKLNEGAIFGITMLSLILTAVLSAGTMEHTPTRCNLVRQFGDNSSYITAQMFKQAMQESGMNKEQIENVRKIYLKVYQSGEWMAYPDYRNALLNLKQLGCNSGIQSP